MAKANLQFSDEEIKGEKWKPVAVHGYEKTYEVSTLGRVRRLENDSQNKAKQGDFINPSFPNNGNYAQYALCLNRKYSRWLAHRLVLITFDGPPPTNKHHAAHINGNSKDNRLSNLKWKTAKENDLDKDLHGTRQNGSKHGCAKLDESKVIEARNLRGKGYSGVDISKMLNVSPSTISLIFRGRTWRHV